MCTYLHYIESYVRNGVESATCHLFQSSWRELWLKGQEKKAPHATSTANL